MPLTIKTSARIQQHGNTHSKLVVNRTSFDNNSQHLHNEGLACETSVNQVNIVKRWRGVGVGQVDCILQTVMQVETFDISGQPGLSGACGCWGDTNGWLGLSGANSATSVNLDLGNPGQVSGSVRGGGIQVGSGTH